MDRLRTGTDTGAKTGRKRQVRLALGVLFLVGIGLSMAFIDFSTARIDGSKIAISTVEQGTLEIKVRGSGQLLPRNVEYIGAQVNGRVVKRHVQAGASVSKGQLLLELSNPQLVAQAEQARAAWEGAVTALRASESELKTNLLDQEIALTQARYNLQSAQLQLEAETELKAANLVSDVAFKRTRFNVAQLQQALTIGQERVNAIRANIKLKTAVNQAQVAQLARALERAQNDVDNLKLMAGIDGIVQAFKVEVGQEMSAGQPVGTIAQPSSLYAELKVPARDAADVKAGQTVLLDTHNGNVNGVVSRVDPAIANGTVVVDVELKEALPAGARPQLAVDGDIYLARLPNAVFVKKPPFAQPDATLSIYKLDASANYAERVVIKSGKLSLTTMQVTQGLRAGDQIITSEAGDWQNKDRIRIK
jgi:HlyD family secretion protein